MSLTDGKPILIQDLLEMFETESNANEKPEDSRQRLAEKMAEAIDKFVRSGLVTTTGTATNQTGNIT
ncbi:hypothetical protein [Chryseobacterium sp. R2A-55]|uniref:hypothetical protein n=1 Tax=Chryseobacterium sp. R2A-55 TaxID=2744445 RepID=UPI001F228B32|nr:hypothetical protein [Chryseobacterium sp. R2A-55]